MDTPVPLDERAEFLDAALAHDLDDEQISWTELHGHAGDEPEDIHS